MRRYRFIAHPWPALIVLAVGFLLSSCKMPLKDASPELFVPPTLVATPFRTPTPDLFQPTPDPRGNCENNLIYLEDVTVPDGTVVKPGEEIRKVWKVQNTGNCDWTSQYSIRHFNGDLLDANKKQKLPLLQPGEEGEIEIIFTAPETIGGYYSGWQAYDNRGKPFGHDLFLEIYVNPATY